MANGTATATRDWLTMIHLGADNSLFEFGNVLLREVRRVGSSDRIAVVVERDPTDAEEPTHRGEMLRGRWLSKDIGTTNGDAKAVVSFARTTANDFRAKHRLLIVWDHGNGWQNVHVFEKVATLSQQSGPGTAAPQALEAIALSNAIADARIDVLGFDSCLMAMIEIAYQLRGRVQYMVASENVVPADKGWPYDSILGSLTIRPEMAPDELARSIVQAFSGSYNGSDDPVTLSALDLSNVEQTVKAIANLSRALVAACSNGERQSVLLARRLCQSFGNPDYIDLVSFCIELQRLLHGTAVDSAAARVRESVGELVLTYTRSSMPSIRGAHGVSIYYPDRPISPLYEQLDFAQRSGWLEFLKMVVTEMKQEAPLATTRIVSNSTARAEDSYRCPKGHSNVCRKCNPKTPPSKASRKPHDHKVKKKK